MIKNRDRKLPQCTKFDTDGSDTNFGRSDKGIASSS